MSFAAALRDLGDILYPEFPRCQTDFARRRKKTFLAHRVKQGTGELIARGGGFRSAVFESQSLVEAGARVIIHSGFWGCGAFGGNRLMMTILQALAASLAQVDSLVFHATNGEGARQAADALAMLGEDQRSTDSLGALLDRIERRGFRWGVSDGT